MIYKAVFYDIGVNTKNNKISHTNTKTVYFSDLKCNFNPIEYCETFVIKNNLCAFRVYQFDKVVTIDIFETAILRVYRKFNVFCSSSSHYIYY